MTNIEKLIEVVSYAIDNNIEWWEELGTIEEAAILLSKVAKEEPSEEEIEYLLVLMDVDPFEVSVIPWSQCIKMLRDKIETEEE